MNTNFLILYRDGSEWGAAGSGALSGALAGTTVLPGIGTAVGAVVGGVAGLISGSAQKKKARDLAAHNPYPTQEVPQAEKDNQQLAAEMANTGLPAEQYAMAMKNIQRQQQVAMRSAQDRRAGVGLIGSIQQRSNDSSAALDAANAQARLNAQRQLIGVNNRVAGYQQSNFDWNQKNLYNQNYNYSQQLLGAGNANIMHGIDSLGAGLINSGLLGSGGRFNTGNPGYSNDNIAAMQGTYTPGIDVGGSVGPAPANGMDLNFNFPR